MNGDKGDADYLTTVLAKYLHDARYGGSGYSVWREAYNLRNDLVNRGFITLTNKGDKDE